MFHRALMFFASAASLLCAPMVAAQPADFYAGKTVKIVFGTSAGGEYGLYSQLIAQHIGAHVPGKPTVIAQSMPGGGGLIALNYAANAAPKDGTVVSLPHINIVQDGLLNPNVRFDPRQFQWIGRVAHSVQVGVISSKAKVRSIADARTRELVAGGVGANNSTALNPRILNVMAGTRFKIVSGYKGTGDVMLAWERGEVDVVTTNWDLIVARYGDQVRAGLVHPLYVYATERQPIFPDVPLVTEFGRTDAEKAFLQIYGIAPAIGRALAFPPGVPAERVAMWRTAFTKMLDDPDFKQAVARGGIRLEPLDGPTLAASVAAVVSLPKDRIAQAAAFYERLLAEVR
jgi:tripartite-type tricarboxylate transporter receptor subunit TctC